MVEDVFHDLVRQKLPRGNATALKSRIVDLQQIYGASDSKIKGKHMIIIYSLLIRQLTDSTNTNTNTSYSSVACSSFITSCNSLI